MTKHPYPIWALRGLIESFKRNSPRYDHLSGFVEERIAQIEAAIKVLEADTDTSLPKCSQCGKTHPHNWDGLCTPCASRGVRLTDLPKWMAGQKAKKK